MIRFLVYPTGNILTKCKLLLKAPQSHCPAAIRSSTSNPVPNPVSRVGHFKKAQVGHFCRAPKPSFPKPRTNPLGLPTHKQQDPPNNSFHLCTVGGVYSCRLPCSPAKVTKVTKVTKYADKRRFCDFGGPTCVLSPISQSDLTSLLVVATTLRRSARPCNKD